MENWIQVFKAGKHTDSSGNSKEWTEADLDQIVSNYNNQTDEQKHEAPVVIGHPKDNHPAYAWVEALKRSGEYLLAKFRDIDAKFAELVNEKKYGKISIALYPNLLLRHIGFLGAVPPAIKGLKAPVFSSEQEYEEYQYSETPQTDINSNNSNNYAEGGTMDDFIKAVVDYLRKSVNEEVANKTLAEMHKLKGNVKPEKSDDKKEDPKDDKKAFN